MRDPQLDAIECAYEDCKALGIQESADNTIRFYCEGADGISSLPTMQPDQLYSDLYLLIEDYKN